MMYVIISCGFQHIFSAETKQEAINIAASVATENNLHSYLVYNKSGDLIKEVI